MGYYGSGALEKKEFSEFLCSKPQVNVIGLRMGIGSG